MPEALADIRVLDFTQAWAGPLCTQTLADFGAEVIKVETGGRPDVSRTMGPFPTAEFDLDASGYNLELNRGKRSVELDLRDPEQVETALSLAAESDVVVENFAPGVMDRLGLSYEAISARKPDVVMLSISGFGATGPDRAAVAFGQQIEAESGLMSVTGYAGGDPLKPGVSYPDPVAGIGGVGAVMAALLHRERTGEGQWIDLSMLELTVSLLVEPLMDFGRSGASPGPRGNSSPYQSPHGIYRCAGEDRWLAIECPGEAEWAALAALASRGWDGDSRFADLAGRREHAAELDAAIEDWTSERDRDGLGTALQAAGVPAAGVYDATDLVADPQLRERGWWRRVDHPRAGALDLPGPMARLASTPARVSTPPPLLGEHTAEVLAEVGRG